MEEVNTRKQKKFRFNFIIYPQFQFAIILLNLIVFGITAIATVVQFFSMMNYIKSIGLDANLRENHPFFAFIQFQESTFLTYFLIGIVVAFIVTSFVTLIISHRMAGPIVRLKSYLREVKEKREVLPLKFRKHDFFKDLPDIVTDALKSLKN